MSSVYLFVRVFHGLPLKQDRAHSEPVRTKFQIEGCNIMSVHIIT